MAVLGSVTVFQFIFLHCLTAAQVVPYHEKYFKQTVDHFSYYLKPYGRETFPQRYLFLDKWWDKETGPIFFYTGNEGDITGFWANSGFIFEIAPQFKALVLFAEHRFYGKSLPFGPVKSFQHPYIDLLTAEQAIADYALLITELKQDLNATRNPVIAFGGSYGGVLSAYMRIKYPNVVAGSISASAPLLLLSGDVDRDFFFQDVSQDFIDAGSGCDDKVKDAFKSLVELTTQGSTGFEHISSVFNLCSTFEIGQYRHLVGWLRNAFTTLAMMDYPYKTDFLAPLPANPVKVACQNLVASSDSLKGLAELANMVYGTPQCHNITAEYIECADPTGCGTGPNSMAWDYQACTQMPMPAGSDNKTDLFPVLPFTPMERDAYCLGRWGVKIRPNWIKTNFWGENLQFTSNIVFSNGDLDPWHRGGILRNISDSLPAVIIKGGAHHLDLRGTNPADPTSVTDARKFETDMITKWISETNCANNVLC